MTTQKASKASPDMVALTLKVDSETYVRLSTLRAKERKLVQEILTEALKSYLAQARA